VASGGNLVPDEARVGQHGSLVRIWAKRGSRPRAPRDQRHEWAYIFGAACPARGATAAFVLPNANTEAFSLHLAEISKEVASGAPQSSPSTALDTTAPQVSRYQTTSPFCPCRPTRQNSIRWKTFGSTCERTSSPSPSIMTTATSSIKAVRPGISSPTTRRPSPRSLPRVGTGQPLGLLV
jgi:hypothetical protein